jgi:putative ATP-dependent endonuclease of OLD family
VQLTHVHIENFRGISRLDMALDPLTVVIGENNHGKTSLFDVLDRCLGGPGGGETGVWEYRDFRRTEDGALETIRVLLTFDPDGTPRPASLTHKLLAAALSFDGDRRTQLHVEFSGDPATGAMRHRFLDGQGRALEVPDSDTVLRRLRQLHPVLLIRLAQPLEPNVLEWTRPEGSVLDDEDEDEGPEEAITRVYHRLAAARGPVPAEELRRAFLAVGALRDQVEGRVQSSLAPVRKVLENFLEGNGSGRAHPMGGGSHNLGLLLVLGALLEMRGRASLDVEATPLIAIEEPEVHLHPMVLSSTWDVIENLQAQTLVTTNSGEFLADVPLGVLRRLVRRDGRIEAFQLRPGRLDAESLRRVGYHVSAKRGAILFARCWLLVEGETEFWLLRELARTLGYDLEAEGVRCVEFAQCGVGPLARLANELGIEWHLVADGDESGVVFAREAIDFLEGRAKRRHVTTLDRRNIEAFLWHHGFEGIYREGAGVGPRGTEDGDRFSPRRIIERAVRRNSKPYLALSVAEECARRGPQSVPPLLRAVIEDAVELAREAVQNGS